MKNAKLIYNVLLMLYPHSFRKAFGAQIIQTFLDNYQDVEKSEGRVGVIFWLSTITDEIKNIMRQHLTPLMEENHFLRVTHAKLVVSAALLIPYFAVFYALLVKVSLALPHPHLMGFGVIVALAALVLLPGVLSVMASYALASALVSILPPRKVRTV